VKRHGCWRRRRSGRAMGRDCCHRSGDGKRMRSNSPRPRSARLRSPRRGRWDATSPRRRQPRKRRPRPCQWRTSGTNGAVPRTNSGRRRWNRYWLRTTLPPVWRAPPLCGRCPVPHSFDGDYDGMGCEWTAFRRPGRRLAARATRTRCRTRSITSSREEWRTSATVRRPRSIRMRRTVLRS
jgi:hypothetical protein